MPASSSGLMSLTDSKECECLVWQKDGGKAVGGARNERENCEERERGAIKSSVR